jgi:hypothetical protein
VRMIYVHFRRKDNSQLGEDSKTERLIIPIDCSFSIFLSVHSLRMNAVLHTTSLERSKFKFFELINDKIFDHSNSDSVTKCHSGFSVHCSVYSISYGQHTEYKASARMEGSKLDFPVILGVTGK